jgi:hypothetical protein
MRWTGHVAYVGESGNLLRVVIGKYKENKSGRSGRR